MGLLIVSDFVTNGCRVTVFWRALDATSDSGLWIVNSREPITGTDVRMAIHLALVCCLQACAAGRPHLEFLAGFDCDESRSTRFHSGVSRAHRAGWSSNVARLAAREALIVEWYSGNWPFCDLLSWSVEQYRTVPAGRGGRESVSDVPLAPLRGLFGLFAMCHLLLQWRWPCSIEQVCGLRSRLRICGAAGLSACLPESRDRRVHVSARSGAGARASGQDQWRRLCRPNVMLCYMLRGLP